MAEGVAVRGVRVELTPSRRRGTIFSVLRRLFTLVSVLSLLLLLRRASRPHVAVLGRFGGTDFYGDVARNPENRQTAGVLVFRVDSAILYFNAEFIRELIRRTMTPSVLVWKRGGYALAGPPSFMRPFAV